MSIYRYRIKSPLMKEAVKNRVFTFRAYTQESFNNSQNSSIHSDHMSQRQSFREKRAKAMWRILYQAAIHLNCLLEMSAEANTHFTFRGKGVSIWMVGMQLKEKRLFSSRVNCGVPNDAPSRWANCFTPRSESMLFITLLNLIRRIIFQKN